MARSRRQAAQAARQSLRAPVQPISEPSEDEEMADASPMITNTPQEEAEAEDEEVAQNDDEDNEENEDDNDGDNKNEDQDEQEQNQPEVDEEEAPTPSRTPRSGRTPASRKRGRPPVGGTARRRGRGSRVQALKTEGSDGDDSSDTPSRPRRGGFRGHRGGRWANRRTGPNSRVVAPPTDEDGNLLAILNDEVEMVDDPEGEGKVSKEGELKGGREYRVRTFKILGRGDRLYMLSTEPARCIGFRDSYLFFQKHKQLYKIIVDEDEKRDLIDRDIIPHSYKGRSIGVVTARSVYREFGARIIIGGKKIVDDYNVVEARERGDVEGELAVPEDEAGGVGAYNRDRYVAWHGASAVYHNNAPNQPLPPGVKAVDGKRRRGVAGATLGPEWMSQHASEASRFNSGLSAARADTLEGVYDIHTNIMQMPGIVQPTHARWEAVGADRDEDITRRLPPINPAYAKAFSIHDVIIEGASQSGFPPPGLGSGHRGLGQISPDIVNELPEECRKAFDQSLKQDMAWKNRWMNESLDGLRSHILTSVEWYPK